MHGERKTEVAHLAEVAIPRALWREIEVEVSGKSRGVHAGQRTRASVPYTGGVPTSVADQNHCSLRVAISLDISVPECTFMRFALYGLPDIFDARNLHRTISPCLTYTDEIIFAKMRARSSEKGTFGRI